MSPDSDDTRSLPVPGLAASIFDLLFQFVDSGIPQEILDGDAEVLRRSRTIVGFALVLILLGFETSLYFHWAHPLKVSSLVDISLALGLILTLAIPVSLRRTLDTAVAANLMIAATYTVIITSVVLFGGIAAPLVHWVAFPPVLAILMGAKRSACAWSFFCVAAVFGLVATDSAGIQLIQSIKIDQSMGLGLWVQRSVDAGSWLAVLLTLLPNTTSMTRSTT
jgi:hypothetical protein